MALWFHYEAFHVEYHLAPCSHVFSVLFSIMITSLGEDRASHVVICLSCPRYFLSFSLPLDIGGWLRNVIVELPGFFVEL